MKTEFQNKIAFITGAASGIGLALSKQLIKAGATVIMTDINDEVLTKEAHLLGAKAVPMVLDVSNLQQFESCIQKVVQDYGAIHYLFNNAGIAHAGEFSGYSRDAWQKILEVNIEGVVNGITLVYPIMKMNGGGHIINTASIAGVVPSGLLVPYATTKHAIVGLSRSLRLEAIDDNINVSILCPGSIDTPMLDKNHPDDMPESARIDARKYLTEITGKPILPELLAQKALEGILKNKEMIFYPKKAKEIWKFGRFFPNKLAKLARKSVAKQRSKK